MSSAVPSLAQPTDPAGRSPGGAGHPASHGHRHTGAPRYRAHAPNVSVLRASLGARLSVVAVLCAVMWAAILWVVA